MELMRESSVSESTTQVIEWPKVPQFRIGGKVVTKEALAEENEVPLEPKKGAKEYISVPELSELVDKNLSANLGVPEPNGTDFLIIAELLQPQTLERPWSKFVRRITSKKTPWPNPELSLGPRCSQLGGNVCWQACGPAKELFNRISESIGDLLDARIDDLEEGEPVAGNILEFGMYMIGKSPSTAQPTLLFTCQSPNPRRRAIKFVKESSILNGHPKIALAENSVCPLEMKRQYSRLLTAPSTIPESFRSSKSVFWKRGPTSQVVGVIVGSILGGLVFLASIALVFFFLFRRRKRYTISPQNPIPETPIGLRNIGEVIVEKTPSVPEYEIQINSQHMGLSPRYQISEAITPQSQFIQDIQQRPKSSIFSNTHGVPFTCLTSGRRATIGGLVHCKGTHYCLTVGHVFENKFYSTTVDELAPTLAFQDDDPQFSFDPEDREPSETDAADIAITSQGSISSLDSTSQKPVLNSNISSEIENQSLPIESNVLHTNQNQDDASKLKSLVELPHATASSIIGTQIGLDWALIELSQMKELNNCKTVETELLENNKLPRRVVLALGEGGEVIVVTGRSGLLRGRVSSSTSMMKLSPRSKFQEVWNVRLGGKLTEGDSGSWVLDAANGDLYGHVVAGVSGGQVAYIIPAYKIFKDIEFVLGGRLELG